jgi:hypothetical protein
MAPFSEHVTTLITSSTGHWVDLVVYTYHSAATENHTTMANEMDNITAQPE